MTSKMAHLLLENLKILVSWDGRMEHAAKITITVEVVSEPGNDLHLLNMEKSPFRFKKAVVDRVKFLAPDSASGSDTAAETTMGKTASKSISLEKLYGGWLPPSPPVRLFPSESASCDVVLPEVPPDAFEYVGERSSERPDCQRSLSGQSTLLSETQTSGDLDLQQTTAREKPQEATDSSSDSLAVRPLMVIKRTESNRRKRTARDAGLSDEDSNAAAGEIPSVDQLDSTQVYPDPPHEQPDEEEQKPASVEPVDAAFADLDLEGLLERNSTMSGESSLNQTNEKRHEARDPDGEPLASGCLDNDDPSDGLNPDSPPSPSPSSQEFVPWTSTSDRTGNALGKVSQNEGDVSGENSFCEEDLDEVSFRQEGRELYLSFCEDVKRALYKITIMASVALISDDEGWFYLSLFGLFNDSVGTSGRLVFDLLPETGMEFRTNGLYDEQMTDSCFEASFVLSTWSRIALRLCSWSRYILRSFEVEQQIRHDVSVMKAPDPGGEPLVTITYNALFTVKPSDFCFAAERCSFTICVDGGPPGDFVYELPENHEELDVIELSNPFTNLIDACRVEIVCLPKQLGTFVLRWSAEFEAGMPSFWQPRIVPAYDFESDESVHLRRVLSGAGDLNSEAGSESDGRDHESTLEDRVVDPEQSEVDKVGSEEQSKDNTSTLSSEMVLDPPAEDYSYFRWLLLPLDAVARFLELHIRAIGTVFRRATVSQLAVLSVILIGLYIKLAMGVYQLVDSTHTAAVNNATDATGIKIAEPPVPVFMRAHSIRLDELYARRLLRDPYLEYICGGYGPLPPKRLARATRQLTARATVTASDTSTRVSETDGPRECNCASFEGAKKRECSDRTSSKGGEKSQAGSRPDVFAPGRSVRDRVDYILGWEGPLEHVS